MLDSGVYTVAPTPFHSDGSVDLKSVEKMTESLLSLGIDGLLVLGVMGEANKLLDEERQQVLTRFISAAAGVGKVIVGTNHPGAIPSRELTRVAEESGADAVMISPPTLAKPNPQTILDYFETIADGSEIEIVLQDHPTSSGVIMSVELINELHQHVDQMTALKLEDPPTAQKMSSVLATSDSLKVFGGLGGLSFIDELDRGASGTMTGFAYPEILKRVHDLHQSGEIQEARQLFDRFLPLILFESQPLISLSVRKHLYRARGFIANPSVRAPAPSLDAGTISELERLMDTVDVDMASNSIA